MQNSFIWAKCLYTDYTHYLDGTVNIWELYNDQQLMYVALSDDLFDVIQVRVPNSPPTNGIFRDVDFQQNVAISLQCTATVIICRLSVVCRDTSVL